MMLDEKVDGEKRSPIYCNRYGPARLTPTRPILRLVGGKYGRAGGRQAGVASASEVGIESQCESIRHSHKLGHVITYAVRRYGGHGSYGLV